jgi:RNA polymerase sigma-70 factor (ECF subfamily)
MDEPDLTQLHAARETFSKLVESVRPELLRYCARMMGSTIDGEDVVQDALARAFYELAQLQRLPALRAWLFRIAHNSALNALVARGRRDARRAPSEAEDVPDGEPSADRLLERNEVVGLAIGRFLDLPPAQRACVVLKDVLDLSLEEISEALSTSIPAVKAALHRGRARLQELGEEPLDPAPRIAHTPELVRYVELFNARDWDGVRAMLAKGVQLDLVGRGVKGMGTYFTNYGGLPYFRMTPAWMDGREVIAVFRDATATRASYVIELRIAQGRIELVRDFGHARHVVDEATFEP